MADGRWSVGRQARNRERRFNVVRTTLSRCLHHHSSDDLRMAPWTQFKSKNMSNKENLTHPGVDLRLDKRGFLGLSLVSPVVDDILVERRATPQKTFFNPGNERFIETRCKPHKGGLHQYDFLISSKLYAIISSINSEIHYGPVLCRLLRLRPYSPFHIHCLAV
jgi:hypothetical protein